MALSGEFSTNKYNGTVGLKLSWTGTQSIVDNTTTIKWTVQSTGGSSSTWWYAAPITVTIGGKTVLSVTSRFKLYGGGGYKKTGSLTVTHADDGTKSVAMSVKAAIYSASVNCTGSKTYTLDKIDRYATIVSASNFTDEGNPSLNYVNSAGTSICSNLRVRIRYGNEWGSTTGWYDVNDAGGTASINLSSSDRNGLRAACPNSKTLAVQYVLRSEIDSTGYYDIVDATMTIVNAAPTGGTLSYQDINSSVVSITGSNQIIVQSKSSLRINVAQITMQKGATDYQTVLTFLDQNWGTTYGSPYTVIPAESYDYGVVSNYSGTRQAKLVITDSRGFITTRTLNIPITAWKAPSATYSLKRVNNYEDDTILRVNGSISSVSGSSMTIKARYKKTTDSSWGSWQTITNNTDKHFTLDKNYEWNVQITVADAFVTTTYNAIVPKGMPIFFVDAKRGSVGVNGFPNNDNQLYVGNTLKVVNGIWTNEVHTDKKDFKSSVTFPSTESSIGGGCRFYYKDGVVYILFQGAGKTHAVNDTLFTLPSAYRPAEAFYVPFIKNSNAYGVVNIGTDGVCAISFLSSTTASGRVYFNTSFPI